MFIINRLSKLTVPCFQPQSLQNKSVNIKRANIFELKNLQCSYNLNNSSRLNQRLLHFPTRTYIERVYVHRLCEIITILGLRLKILIELLRRVDDCNRYWNGRVVDSDEGRAARDSHDGVLVAVERVNPTPDVVSFGAVKDQYATTSNRRLVALRVADSPTLKRRRRFHSPLCIPGCVQIRNYRRWVCITTRFCEVFNETYY